MGKAMSRARRSTRRYSPPLNALKSACLSRSRSLAVIAASKSTFWSCFLGWLWPNAFCGESASRTRGRRLLGSALPSALGSNCASNLLATSGSRK